MSESVVTNRAGLSPKAEQAKPQGTFSRWFIVSAGVILFTTGAAKVFSAWASSTHLGFTDPIIGIKFRTLILLVGLLEFLLSFACFLRSMRRFAYRSVLSISSAFLVYRIGLWWIGWQKPCACWGDLTAALHLSPEFSDNVMRLVLGYLVLGSVLSLRILSRVDSSSEQIDSATHQRYLSI